MGGGKRRRISTAGANATAAAAADLLSSLPEEIIHGILARLPSYTDAAKLSILSKRWTQIWNSYPIFELSVDNLAIMRKQGPVIDYTDDSGIKRVFAAAAASLWKKFSRFGNIEAVRIAMYGSDSAKRHRSLVRDVLNYSAKNPPQLLDLQTFDGCEPSFPESLFNNKFHFCGLKVLKLGGFDLKTITIDDDDDINRNNNPFACFGSSLKQLSLRKGVLSDNRVLDKLIEAASVLEELELEQIQGIQRFQIRNHAILKVVKVDRLSCKDEKNCNLEIAGLDSLEILHIKDIDYLMKTQVWSTPKVRVLHWTNAWIMANEKINNFISNFPSLESLVLDRPLEIPTSQLKISSRSNKLREVSVSFDGRHGFDWRPRKQIVEVDAPGLTSFTCRTFEDGLPKLLWKIGRGDHHTNDNEQSSSTPQMLSFHFISGQRVNVPDLKEFIAKYSQRFRLTLQLGILTGPRVNVPDLNQLPPTDVVPVIEHVIYQPFHTVEDPDSFMLEEPLKSIEEDEEDFVETLFSLCHPKCLSFRKRELEYPESMWQSTRIGMMESIVQKIWKLVMERNFSSCSSTTTRTTTTTACPCWRHQLQDAKMVIKAANGGSAKQQEDNNTFRFSPDSILSIGQQEEEVCLMLTWQ